jgi:hypothetical protein
VLAFFSDSQNAITSLLFVPEGLAAAVVIAAGVVSLYYLNKTGVT